MKLQPVSDPILGNLMPDRWGDSLKCFREIRGLKMFVPPRSHDSLSRLDEAERRLVESWTELSEKLVRSCRDFDIFYGLRSLGVFEVAFTKTSTGVPSDEQITAYQFFQEHQQRICENIGQALLRYYQRARERDPDWFDTNDCPALHSVAELAPLATFDSLTFTTHSCEGQSVLCLSWSPNWDEEHGLQMAVWKDQVVGIGFEDVADLAVPEMDDYLTWNRGQMSAIELDCLSRVCASMVRPDDDDEDIEDERESEDEFD